jgi:DNA-binding CsgD family transcriptional regulator
MPKPDSAQATPQGATLQSPRRVIGRGRDPEQFANTLLSGNSLIIYGALGSGKSHLADAVDSHLRARGVLPLKLRGSSSTRDVPLGALRATMDVQLTELLATADSPSASHFLSYAAAKAGKHQPVIAVDDAHLLDPQTVEWLARLTSDGAVVLLLTCAPVPAIDGRETNAETVRLLTSLWVQGQADRVDLEPLTTGEADELVAQFAPGAVFDMVTRTSLLDRSGGSPLLLRELTAEALHHQFLLEDRDTISPSVSEPSGRIMEMLRHQLAGLNSAQVHGLALLGRVDSLAHAQSLAIFTATDLRDLMHRGFIRRAGAGDDRLIAHQLFAEAAVSISDPSTARELASRLAEALLQNRAAGRALSPTESVIVAESWSQSASLTPEVDEWGLDAVVEILIAAADKCFTCGIREGALSFTARAYKLRPDTSTAVSYSRALSNSGRVPQALRLLLEAEDKLESPRDAVRLIRWWAVLAARQPIISDALDAVVRRAANWFPNDMELSGEVELVILTGMSRQLNRRRLATSAEKVALSTSFDPFARMRATTLAAAEYAGLGNLARARELLAIGSSLGAQSLPADSPTSDYDHDVAEFIFFSAIVVRSMAGEDQAQLAAELEQRVRRSVRDHRYSSLGYSGVAAAHLATIRGDNAAAAVELRAAESRFLRSDPYGWLPWAQCLYAKALASMGRLDEALSKLRESTTTAARLGTNQWFTFVADCTAAELLMLSGASSSPRTLSSTLVHELDSGGPVLKTSLLYELFVSGEPASNVVVEIERAAASTDIPLLAVAARRVRATAENNPTGLESAAEDFAALGAYGQASATYESAAAIHRERGDRSASTASRARAAGLADATRNPGSSGTALEPTSGTERLTGRESEVAVLAAKGLSNREIARTLFLSVRTVESHLYQARVKLGAASRKELGALLSVDVAE